MSAAARCRATIRRARWPQCCAMRCNTQRGRGRRSRVEGKRWRRVRGHLPSARSHDPARRGDARIRESPAQPHDVGRDRRHRRAGGQHLLPAGRHGIEEVGRTVDLRRRRGRCCPPTSSTESPTARRRSPCGDPRVRRRSARYRAGDVGRRHGRGASIRFRRAADTGDEQLSRRARLQALRRGQPLLRSNRRVHEAHRTIDGQTVHAVGRTERSAASAGRRADQRFHPEPDLRPRGQARFIAGILQRHRSVGQGCEEPLR